MSAALRLVPCVSRVIRGLLPAVLLGAALLASAPAGEPAAFAAPKAKKIVPPTNAYEAVLDAQRPAVVACVMALGLDQGAPSVELKIRILVNNSGQTFGCDVGVKQQVGDPKATSECIKQALLKARFPTSTNGLTELRREWKFAMQ